MKLKKLITGLTAAMLVVASMTTGVFAATSPSKENAASKADIKALNVRLDGKECELPVVVTDLSDSLKAQADAAAKKKGYTVIHAFDLELTEASVFKKDAAVKVFLSDMIPGMKVKVLHLPDGKDGSVAGNWEVITPDEVGAGYVTATFTSLSPVAFVLPASSATGEGVNVLLIAALACLAGAVVCGVMTKKAN